MDEREEQEFDEGDIGAGELQELAEAYHAARFVHDTAEMARILGRLDDSGVRLRDLVRRHLGDVHVQEMIEAWDAGPASPEALRVYSDADVRMAHQRCRR